MYYIALCDDSRADVAVLAQHLNELKKEFQIEHIPFLDGKSLVKSYEEGRRYDLIILDMCMDELNGIETAELIRKMDDSVPIIIVTATVQYAVDGYKINASRYIVKPVCKEEFINIVRKTLDLSSKKRSKFFTFKSDCGMTKVKMDDIYYFESDIRTIHLVTKDSNLTFTGRISKVEEQMKCEGFFRAHKSFIVNLNHVYNIFKDYVTLDNGTKIPLSKYKRKDIGSQLLTYMENNA